MMDGGGYAFDQPSQPAWSGKSVSGMAAHDVDGLWSGDSKENGPDLCAEVVFNRRCSACFPPTAHPNIGCQP
jgi:hypothetical protein